MRIAIASDDQTHVAAHTGRCAGFLIYDIDEQRATRVCYRENRFTAHAQDGCDAADDHHAVGHSHHSHAALLEALSDCVALITGGLGPRLVQDLAQRGVQALICRSAGADEAAEQYRRGELALATAGDACCGH